VNDDIDFRRRDPGIADSDGDAIEDRLLRRRIIRQYLGRKKLAAHVEHDIGKGAADVGAQADILAGPHGSTLRRQCCLPHPGQRLT